MEPACYSHFFKVAALLESSRFRADVGRGL
jgi:hypothetical protein